MEILSHDPSTGLMLFKGEPAEIAYNKQMKDQFMKLMAKRVSNAVRKSTASLHKDGFDDYAQEMVHSKESCFMVDTVHKQWRKWAEAITASASENIDAE